MTNVPFNWRQIDVCLTKVSYSFLTGLKLMSNNNIRIKIMSKSVMVIVVGKGVRT